MISSPTLPCSATQFYKTTSAPAGQPISSKNPHFGASSVDEKAAQMMLQAMQFRQNPYVLAISVMNTTILALIGPLLNNYFKNFLENKKLYEGIITELKQADVAEAELEHVIGQEQAKKSINAIVKQITQAHATKAKAPKKRFSFGKKETKGPGQTNFIVMDGLPGTGKTYTMKGMVNRLWQNNIKTTTFVFNCALLNGSVPGVGPRAIRQLIKQIKQSPHDNIVILLDEADSVGSSRTEQLSPDRRDTLLAFLQMTDGLTHFNGKNVHWIFSTNKYETLDNAFMSRMDQRISMNVPNAEELQQLFKQYLQQKNLALPSGFDWPLWLKTAQGLVGRDIEKLTKQLKNEKSDEEEIETVIAPMSPGQFAKENTLPETGKPPFLPITQAEIFKLTENIKHKNLQGSA